MVAEKREENFENFTMEQYDDFEIEPNRVAEYYRTYQAKTTTNKIEKQLSFIEIDEDGSTLLGSSNMTGRQWCGSITYFSSPEDAPDENKIVCNFATFSGVTDAKFLSTPDTIAVGEDSGAISVLGITRNVKKEDEAEGTPRYLHLQGISYLHDDVVSSLDVFSGDKDKLVSASYDGGLAVWNVQSLTPEVTYRNGHSRQVMSVSCSPIEGNSTFASGALDHNALIWDQRQVKPALLGLDCKVGATAVAWKPDDGHLLAVGTETGYVRFVDQRQPGQEISNVKIMSRPIFKLCFSKTSPNLLAVCGDDTNVSVLDCSDSSNIKTRHEDSRHGDFVRGLAWGKTGALYSCGFDSLMLKHKVTT